MRTEESAAGAGAPGSAGERVGDSIGPYRLLSILGEGGFGIVYLAERREPHTQRVALKVIKPGMDSRAVIARFEQERQALAVMDHPNVARVFDGGATPHGRPYFVMELVQGEPITVYCDRRRATIRERLELFIHVCEAVQHAHTKGVIHRDLKPSNVLVAEAGGRPVPKVIDFGVAKAISPAMAQGTIFTERGQIIGTPEYMSPEQAEMGALDIDTRTDVYALGVILYELLVGALPFESESLRRAGLAEVQRMIREQEPPRPSTKLTEMGPRAAVAAQCRQTRLDALARQLRSELEWIPLKAMRKERDRRYRTPLEMAEDVRNYFEGRPLIAGPESRAYRARKLLRRHRAGVAAAAAVGLALVGGIAGAGWGMMRANAAAASEREARGREAGERARAEAVNAFLHDMFASISPEKARGREVTVREVLDDAAAKVGSAFPSEPAVEASLRETLGETYVQLAMYKEGREQFRRALDLRERVLGPRDRETLVSRYNLAVATLQLGELPEAIRLLRETIDGRTAALGERHAETLMARSLLGFATQLGGDNEGALKIYSETYEAQKLAAGEGDRATLETLSSIADVLQDLGRLEEAEEVSRRLVQAAVRSLGADAVPTLTAQSIRASILKDLGRYGESESLCREVLAAKTRLYGADHAETLTTSNVLAMTLEQQKKHDEAAGLLERAVEGATRRLGPEHNTTLTYRSNLARQNHLRGRLEEAEGQMRDLLAVQRRVSGDDAVETLTVMNNLGLLLLDRKKAVEAEPIFRQMAAGIDRALPEGHWMRGQARVNRGQALRDQKKFEEAEAEMLAGYERMAAALPAGHGRLRGAAGEIAEMYREWGRGEEAGVWGGKAGGKKSP